MSVTIYALSDPRSPTKIRYIGKTTNLARRIQGHLTKAEQRISDTHAANWLRSLLAEGVRPHVTVLANVDESQWQDTERQMIAGYRQAGHDLTNICKGGEGSSMEPETRAKLSAALKGRRPSLASIEKVRAARMGTHHAEMTRYKMAASRKKVAITPRPVSASKALGERHGGARLTSEIVRQIREYNGTASMISERFGISRGYAWQIMARKKWSHV